MKLKVETARFPLPRRRGLSWLSSAWGMANIGGKNAANAVQLQMPEFSDPHGGIRLARGLMEVKDEQ